MRHFLSSGALAALAILMTGCCSVGNHRTQGDLRYLAIAKVGVSDLIKNYWVVRGDGGEILPTWTGILLDTMPDKRGGIWERGMMLFALDNYVQSTGDSEARKIIESESRRFMRLYAPKELEAAGTLLHTAADDCGWHAALYLVFYRYSGQTWMRDRAANLLDNAYAKWLDDTWGGGLWYRDEQDASKKIKSLYAASIVLDSLEVWKLTGDRRFRDRALGVYEWMESHLLRPDGVYFCDYNAAGPMGKDNPANITEAGSVSFLGGNMAMAVIHARLYRMTRETKYLERAVHTAQGILDTEVRDGLYLNDRDAWTNAAFMGQFVREVLTLPGVSLRHKDVLYRTTDSIHTNDRTPEGYYGGCWGGPADGPDSKWSAGGSTPNQIMTSANAVNVMVAAAALATGK